MKNIPISWIGSVAKSILSTKGELQIMGISSRGIFLNSSSRWIIFLSSEKFRGPLTINLGRHSEIFSAIHTNQKAQPENEYLIFKEAGYQLDLNTAQIWEPNKLLSVTVTNSIEKIAAILQPVDDPVLNQFLGLPSVTNIHEDLLLEILRSLKAGNHLLVEQTAEKLLGSGSGLTPEGDDFIIGLILSMKLDSSNSFNQQNKFLPKFIQTAYSKTTTISANLMECAAEGQADERLISVYNALKYGAQNGQLEIEELLNWGNTSGRMALRGISAGILGNL